MNKHNLKCPICDGNEAKSWHVCDECSILTCDYCTNNVDWNGDEEEFDKIICDTCYQMPKFHPTPIEHVGPKTIALTGLSQGDPVTGIFLEIKFAQNVQPVVVDELIRYKSIHTEMDQMIHKFLVATRNMEPGQLIHPELLDATRCNLCFSPSKHAIDHPRGLCYPCSTR